MRSLWICILSSADRLKISDVEIKEVKERCMEFLDKAIEEVQLRLPENATLFQGMNKISPKEIYYANDLTNLAERFKNASSDIDGVNKELRQMKLIDVPEDLKEDPVKFWNYFKEFKDAAGESRFNNLAQLALALYTLPYSNAEVERIFSKMNHFKSKLRNKMASPTTDALFRVDGGLKWRGEQCHIFNVTDNMKRKFSSETIYKVNEADDFVLGDEIFD